MMAAFLASQMSNKKRLNRIKQREMEKRQKQKLSSVPKEISSSRSNVLTSGERFERKGYL